MKLIPDIHLEDWKISHAINTNKTQSITTYEKGKIKITDDSNKDILDLYIESSNGVFNHIKETDNYWEIMSYNTFLNDDIIDDEENVEFQLDLMNNIRDSFSNFETLIFNKKTGYAFGVNNLIDSGGWNDKTLEHMWNEDEIVVMELLEDVDPKLLTKTGWEDININFIGEDIDEIRNRHIEEIL
tara:strand:+ start:4109 stop:4663 length:555 start_codon:yes stop_codon:yes gene_type:complete